MKALILFFIVMTLMAEPGFAYKDFQSEQEAIDKLKAYQASDLAQDRKSRELKSRDQKLFIDQMFSDLNSSVAQFGKKKTSEDLIYQMGRVAVLTFENDPTNFAVEILFPVYQKDKKEFEKKLQKLPQKDRAQLMEAITDYEREISKGNG